MTDETRFFELADMVLRARSLPKDERDDFLNAACGGDDELRAAALRLSLIPTAQADALERFRPFGPSLERPDLEPGALFGKYRIVKKIADGGMSTVYLGEHTRSHHRVAIKFLNPLGLSFSAHEHEILGELSHDSIARLFDSDVTDDGIPYLVMEYVDGEPLSRYCEERSLPLEDRLKLFIAICGGIQHAHAAPIVHRDIKPGNILVRNDGVPKIVDFGIARSLPPDKEALTHTAHLPLTLAFASPEQVLGKRTGISSDIYSLGVVLCVLLTGRLPYRIRTMGDLYTAIPTQEPTRPSELLDAPRIVNPAGELHYPYVGPEPPPDDTRRLKRRLANDLDFIMLKALRKEPEKRYQTVAELATDVGSFLNDGPVSARKGSTRYVVWKYCKKHTRQVIGYGIAALAILGLLIGLAISRQEATRQRDAATLAAERSNQLSAFLISIFDLGDPFRDLTTPPTVTNLLEHSVRQLRSGTLESPKDKVLFLETLGKIYSSQGDYRMGLSLYYDALKETHDTPIDQARILTELAATHVDLGQFPEARRALQRAQTLQDSIPSISHADIAKRLLISGRERALSGAWIDAIDLFNSALSLVTNMPTEQKMLATIYEERSLSLGDVGRFEEALKDINIALEIGRRLYQAPHPIIAKIIMRRAKILRTAGRYQEAFNDLQEAEKVLVASLGPTHPAVSEVIEERGSVAIEQQEFDLAETMFTQALDIRTRILGPTHPATLRAYQHLGEAVQGKGDLPRAERMLRKALADNERFGVDKTSIGLLLNNLGLLLLQRGSTAESRVLLERALHIREQTHGKNSGWVAISKGNLSNLYYEIGRRQEALKELREAIQLIKTSFGNQHHYVATGLNNLGFMYAVQGNYSAAIPLYREALSINSKLGLGNSLIATYFMTNLADALLETGQLQEAYRHIRRAQTILRKESAPALPQRDVLDGIEGKYHLLRGEYSEAEAKLTPSFKGLQTKTGLQSQKTQAALKRLILLYERWSKPDKAAEYRKLLKEATSRTVAP